MKQKAVKPVATEPKKAPRYQELQAQRLTEVQAITIDAWQELLRELRRPSKLPKLNEHFRKHGSDFADLGIETPEQYQALFLEHIQRPDLKIFTYITTQKEKLYRYWVLAGVDNRAVALYNESRMRHWSFWRPNDFEGYLQGGRGWWLRVEESAGKLRVRRW